MEGRGRGGGWRVGVGVGGRSWDGRLGLGEG